MASSLVITLKSSRTNVDLKTKFGRDTTDPRGEAGNVSGLFERLAAGLESGNFTVQYSASAPVRAAATATLTNASIANNDTVTVAGVVFTAKTSGATGPQFNIGGTATITAANLAAAVNATLVANQLVTATSAAGVVTFTAQAPGLVGNFLTLTTSNGTGFVVTTFTGGAGGAETSPVAYSRGL